ncbi:unnamed protein product, partial [Oppiella nova]
MSVGAKQSSLLFSPAEDEYVNDFHLAHYGSFAIGGAGMVMVEATAVEERGKITPNCAGIWRDDHIEPWKRITNASKLFSPVKLGGLTLKNRIGVSPMVTWVSEDGYVNDFQLAHYGSFAIGGVGLIVVE